MDSPLVPSAMVLASLAVEPLPGMSSGETDSQLLNRLRSLLEDLEARAHYRDRLAVRQEGRIVFLEVEEVDWIDAARNYVRINSRGQIYRLRTTMGTLEAKLDPRKFLRIHRSTIVNVDRIREIQPLFHGELLAILAGGQRLTVSRRYRRKLSDLLV